MAGLAAAPLITSCSHVPGLTGPSGPPTYYLSPAGNDAATGTTPGSAWRTLSKASTAVLRPGSRLLLEGGKRFTGQLRLSQRDGGNPGRPVTIGTYGRGRATIVSPHGDGIVLFDTAGIGISNLIVRGGSARPAGAGINLYSSEPANRKLSYVRIDHVDVSHFADGIAVGGVNAGAGFRDVKITDSALHGNLDNGFLSYGPPFDAAAPSYSNQDISLSHVTAYHNLGDPAEKAHNSGSGIVLGSVRTGNVSWSVAYGNGGAGGDPHEGPQGVWTYDSTAVVIEHSLAYGNRSGGRYDGGGFDLDRDTSDCVLQYNFSYGNDGAGYLIYSGHRTGAGNVARFNISSGDVRAAEHYGGISVIGRVDGAAVYQNTVVMRRRADSRPSLALRLGRSLRAVTVRNNIFVTAQPGPIVFADKPFPRAAVLLQGNDYFSSRGQWSVWWGNASYYSLAAWQTATGQETRRAGATGYAVDPEFAGPLPGTPVTRPGNGGNGFRLRPGSPLARAGLNLAHEYRLHSGLADYAGHPVSAGAPNVGAQ